MQAERFYSALFVLVDGSALSVNFEIHLPLAVMSSTKSEVYYDAREATQLPLNRLFPKFERCQMLTVSEGDGAIAMATRGHARKNPEAHCWHHVCEVHHIARIIKLVMRPADIERHISSMISVSLCLSPANAVKMFRRRCLGEVVEQRCVYIRSPPPPQFAPRRREALLLFFSGNSRAAVIKRSVINELLNSDWSRDDRLEHFCSGPECCREAERCVQRMKVGLAFAMAGSGPPLWPRSPWTGAILASNWQLLMSMAHSLLQLVFTL